MEHRRVVNQQGARMALSQSDYEQLRRALLMIVAQFKTQDPEGVYNIEVRVVPRERSKTKV